jgi:hypothetical protein
MARIRWAFALLIALTAAAGAAEVTYPPGSRVGLIPPPGLRVSPSFPGFEDREKNVAILLTVLPPEAYAEFEKSDSAEALKRQGAILEKRETLTLPGGQALLVIGRDDESPKETPKEPPKETVKEASKPPIKSRTWLLVASNRDLTVLVTARIPDAAQDAYPEAAIRAALASLAVRDEVPVEEQLGLLPFKVGELAGFKVGGVLAGRAIMLTDAGGGKSIEPQIRVTLLPGTSADLSGREDLARKIFGSIPGLKDVRISESQALRMGGQPGHEIMASAKEAETGAALNLVQWLRFGGGASLHLVGVAPAAGWTQAYARFRMVRDGIEPR